MEPNGLKLRKGGRGTCDFEGLALGLRVKPQGKSMSQAD